VLVAVRRHVVLAHEALADHVQPLGTRAAFEQQLTHTESAFGRASLDGLRGRWRKRVEKKRPSKAGHRGTRKSAPGAVVDVARRSRVIHKARMADRIEKQGGDPRAVRLSNRGTGCNAFT
jgi:hypothetical protein